MKLNDSNMNNKKAQYFAQYLGQKVLRHTEWEDKNEVSELTCGKIEISCYDEESRLHLLLKPLSLITTEDAIEVAELLGYKDCKIHRSNRIVFIKPSNFEEEQIHIDFFDYEIKVVDTSKVLWFPLPPPSDFIQQGIDLLRSKGYAMPFRNYSVRELVHLGWLELKTI